MSAELGKISLPFRDSSELMAATPYVAFQHITPSRHAPDSEHDKPAAQYVARACRDLESRGYVPNDMAKKMLQFGAGMMLGWAYSMALSAAVRLSDPGLSTKPKSVGAHMFAFLDRLDESGSAALTGEEYVIAVTLVLGTLCSCVSGCYPYNPKMPTDPLEATLMRLGRFGTMHPDLTDEEVEICIGMMRSAAHILHSRTSMSCSG